MTLVLAYKYLILIPLAIIEGPILSIIAGFLVSLGFLNAFMVYIIVVLGDVIGDSMFYSLGRWGHTLLHEHGHRVGATKERLAQAKEYFGNHHGKAITMSKLIHGIGVAGLVTAGSLKIPYRRFIGTCVLISIPQAAVLLIIGIIFGHTYVQIGKYLDYFAATISIVVLGALAAFMFYKVISKKSTA